MIGVAVEIGGAHATCALVDESSIVAASPVEVKPTLESTLELVCERVHALLDSCGVGVGDCRGVAVGFCGIVDPEAGRIIDAPAGKYVDACHVDLVAWSGEAFGLPLRLENDARLALLGEHRGGAASGHADVAMITLGTGIGGVAMIDGEVLVSKHHLAGTIGGHLPISTGGRPCTCGGHGCAESEASTWALPAVCADWPGFATSSLSSEERIDYRALFRHVDRGDAVATEVLDHSCAVWGTLAVTLIHAYDAELVVFGGAVMARAGEILPRVRGHVHARAWTPGRAVAVVAAALGDDAPLLGAIPLLGLDA